MFFLYFYIAIALVSIILNIYGFILVLQGEVDEDMIPIFCFLLMLSVIPVFNLFALAYFIFTIISTYRNDFKLLKKHLKIVFCGW